MKRKLKCGTCETTKNSATGKTLYLLGDSDVSLMNANHVGECWDCGEKRRDAEKKKKQDRAEALVGRFAANDL